MAVLTKLGTAKVDITPLEPVPLAGFGNRRGPFESVSRRLYARVWLFEQEAREDGPGQVQGRAGPAASPAGKRRVLLVQADIICWPSERIDSLRASIRSKVAIDEACIIMQASHTHGGPQTTMAFLPSVGEYVPAYMELLEARVLDAVGEALHNLAPVRMERGKGECLFGIHRRLRVNGKIAMAPNPDVPVDHEVTVLRFREETGAVKGVLFHYTCHPTTTNSMRVTSEHPGAAMEKLEAELGGGAIASFLQGCCGDVRPALHANGRFYAGSDEDVTRLGGELADEVLRVLGSPLEELPFAPLEAKSVQVDLPFAQLPTREELQALTGEADRWGEWSRLMLERPELLRPSVPMHMSLVRLGEGLGLLTMDGEIVLEYGDYIKRESGRNVLPLAYSNGMIGYVPTAVQVDEGGYEGRDSFPLFSLPAVFDRTLERKIKQGIDELLQAD